MRIRNSRKIKMKLINLLFLLSALYSECANIKDFQIRVANERILKNPPLTTSDFNLIFDIEVRSESIDGVFVNVASMGGCHFKEVNFLHQDGTVGKPFGKSYTLPLSDNETQTFVFVKGDQLIDPTYRKVATICTDLKKEIVSLDLIAKTSAVRRFSGVVYAELKIFNVSKSRFETYQFESNFEAERLPTGNMMNFSMKGITLKELKELTNQ